VQELARRRLVDVLGRRHELCPGGADGDVDGHVVFTRAGQSVHLVHDDVADAAQLANELEHGLEVRAVGGLGRFALVDELRCDDSAEPVSGALVGLSLCGDGEAFRVEVRIGLGRRGHSKVADGELHAVRDVGKVEPLQGFGEYAHSAASRWSMVGQGAGSRPAPFWLLK